MWYRGYGEMSKGAGTRLNCRDSENVATALGAHTSAIGHTTHPSIKNFCPQPRTAVPTFVTDTHYKHCTKYNECDYKFDRKFQRRGFIDRSVENAPQSLRVKYW